mmetsp:Transcript_75605/g.133576  ORF Transcript_75605/g.133576 Transcript_75605/m.133576 type:complete len:148 (-) Transcript_75605:331-774(-)
MRGLGWSSHHPEVPSIACLRFGFPRQHQKCPNPGQSLSCLIASVNGCPEVFSPGVVTSLQIRGNILLGTTFGISNREAYGFCPTTQCANQAKEARPNFLASSAHAGCGPITLSLHMTPIRSFPMSALNTRYQHSRWWRVGRGSITSG